MSDFQYYPLKSLSEQKCKRYPDIGILLTYNDDDYSQGYDQKKEAFKALTKENILQLYISEDDFRSSTDGDYFWV